MNPVFESAVKPREDITLRELCAAMYAAGEHSLMTEVWWDGDHKVLRIERRLFE